MTTLLLSAGKATRLDGIAPRGCKAMTIVGGRTMVEWWTDISGETPTVVCRIEHVPIIPEGVDLITCDQGGGPARALKSGLLACDREEPVTVAYADTWLASLPEGDEWCAVAAAAGGRPWDVVEDGLVAYYDLPPAETALVCVGAYRFADRVRLERAIEAALASYGADGREVGMGDVVNLYGLPFVPAQGWQDVGDPVALRAWRAA